MKPAALFGSVRWIVLTASFCPSSCANDWHGTLWEATTFYGTAWSSLGVGAQMSPVAQQRGQAASGRRRNLARLLRRAPRCWIFCPPHADSPSCARNATIRSGPLTALRVPTSDRDSALLEGVESPLAHPAAWRPTTRKRPDAHRRRSSSCFADKLGAMRLGPFTKRRQIGQTRRRLPKK